MQSNIDLEISTTEEELPPFQKFSSDGVPASPQAITKAGKTAMMSGFYTLLFAATLSGYFLASSLVIGQEGPAVSMNIFLIAVFGTTGFLWGALAFRKGCPTFKWKTDLLLPLPWSVMYLSSWYLPIATLQFLSAGHLNVVLQMRVLTTPLLAYFILREKRSSLQLTALTILMMGILGIMMPEESESIAVTGVALAMSLVCISSAGSLYAQLACKRSSSPEVFACVTSLQMVALIGGIMGFEASVAPVSPAIQPGNYLFLYWFACVAVEVGGTLVVTRVSAVGFSLGSAMTVPVTMFAELAIKGEAVDKHDALSAMIVAAAVIGYALATEEHKTIQGFKQSLAPATNVNTLVSIVGAAA